MNTDNIKLTEEQKHALEMMESGQNIFLSGGAGTGKSVVLSEFIKRNEDKKEIVVCAPFGTAAQNINGITLHNAFGERPSNIERDDHQVFLKKEIIDADVIIIDEISTVRLDFFEYLFNSLNNALIGEEKFHSEINAGFKRKQIILNGDFYQLPPVLGSDSKEFLKRNWGIFSEEDAYAFNSKIWEYLCLHPIILKTVMRQSDDAKNKSFVEALNKIRIGDASGIE